MSLCISLAVNGEEIDYVVVTNRGPVDGKYAEGDWAGGGGVRRYEWKSWTDDLRGFVEHARADGAAALASKVLAAVAEANRPTEGDPNA